MELCRQTLLPLGIDFRPGDGASALPFDDGSFDMVINRHGGFFPSDIDRLLRPGGIFVTQQVGAENDRELVELLCGKFHDAGFEILEAKECYRPIRFYDVGALVWFARIIEWEFPGFSVDACRDRLLIAQRILEQNGCIEGKIHRFLLAAKK